MLRHTKNIAPVNDFPKAVPLEEARRLLDAAKPALDVKRPLHREPPPSSPFPINALGSLRPAAEAIHQITQAPLAICAQSILAVGALAIQAHRDVQSPIGRRPLTGLFVSIAESGERKSAADRLALKPVLNIEREWRDQAEIETAAYKNAREIWEAARNAAKRKAKTDTRAMAEAFAQIGPEPRAPRSPMMLVSDATPEAIALHLADGRSFAGQFSAEGGLVIGGTAMSDENRMRAGAFYNLLWDGDAIRRSRSTMRSAFLPGRRFTMHLMMQTNVASALLGDDVLTQLGTVARLLIVAPNSTAGTRLYREPPASAWAALSSYENSIEAWLRLTPKGEADNPDVLDPEPMHLEHDALNLWIKFHDLAEKSLSRDGPLAPIRSWGSKMPEHAVRLAALLAATDDPETLVISAETMARGIVLVQHYATEMLRLAGGANVHPDLVLARRLLDWWQARPDPRCHLAAIYQHGPSALRDAFTARRIVNILVAHGWVRRLEPGAEIDGQARREGWALS
ncbi:MAG: hypothetical protein B7Z78_10680 [Rhodospirillales bacterium 20-60-12]|nr:MAG: hypothetical protein B7Z78_10680 [Rhodospirillales bacterium 20-60-12]